MPAVCFCQLAGNISLRFIQRLLAFLHSQCLGRRYVGPALQYKARHCDEMMATCAVSCVRAALRLFDALALPSHREAEVRGQDGKEQEWATLVELWWQFSVAWGLGGALTEEGRKACVPARSQLSHGLLLTHTLATLITRPVRLNAQNHSCRSLQVRPLHARVCAAVARRRHHL